MKIGQIIYLKPHRGFCADLKENERAIITNIDFRETVYGVFIDLPADHKGRDFGCMRSELYQCFRAKPKPILKPTR